MQSWCDERRCIKVGDPGSDAGMVFLFDTLVCILTFVFFFCFTSSFPGFTYFSFCFYFISISRFIFTAFHLSIFIVFSIFL